MDPAAKASKHERMNARYHEVRESGMQEDKFAAACAARMAARRVVRATCFWHLVALIYLGPLEAALRAQDEAKRIAAQERARAWYVENPERAAATMRAYRAQNRHLCRAWGRKYDAAKLNAVPSWADPDAIARTYLLAEMLTDATGEPWHVDHRVPLQSPLVCGLHCEANLQPIPAKMNLAKSNRFWPDMP